MGKNKERAKFFSSLFTDFKKDRGEEIMREDQLYRMTGAMHRDDYC
jgi:hypothetical protein